MGHETHLDVGINDTPEVRMFACDTTEVPDAGSPGFSGPKRINKYYFVAQLMEERGGEI